MSYPRPQRGERLTEREIEILHLAAQGLTSRQIGNRIYLSIETVKTHLYKAGIKLGTNGRVTSVAAAIARGDLQASYDAATGLRVTR